MIDSAEKRERICVPKNEGRSFILMKPGPAMSIRSRIS